MDMSEATWNKLYNGLRDSIKVEDHRAWLDECRRIREQRDALLAHLGRLQRERTPAPKRGRVPRARAR